MNLAYAALALGLGLPELVALSNVMWRGEWVRAAIVAQLLAQGFVETRPDPLRLLEHVDSRRVAIFVGDFGFLHYMDNDLHIIVRFDDCLITRVEDMAHRKFNSIQELFAYIKL